MNVNFAQNCGVTYGMPRKHGDISSESAQRISSYRGLK